MPADQEHFDDLETRSPDAREAALMQALSGQVANAKSNAPYFAKLLADVTPEDITSREALAKIPVTRKSDLIELQKNNPPLGGLITCTTGKLKRTTVFTMVLLGAWPESMNERLEPFFSLSRSATTAHRALKITVTSPMVS